MLATFLRYYAIGTVICHGNRIYHLIEMASDQFLDPVQTIRYPDDAADSRYLSKAYWANSPSDKFMFECVD